MFTPRFRYTNKIVRLLTRISAAREVILNSPLIPGWEVALRREAIIRSAHSSTSIEGNRLSLEQVSDLARGREVMATRKDRQEVLNYLKVLENIGKLVKGNSLDKNDILEIHRIVTKGTLDNPGDCGVYRNRYVVVANRLTGEVFFKPPKNEDVPGLIKELVKWINSEEAKELDPVIEAGIVHVEGVNVSIEEVKKRVIKLSSERLRRAKEGQIALTERQMRIVEHINLNAKITNKDIRGMFKISSQAAHKEINKLVKLGIVKAEGKGRGLYYDLV